MAYSIICSAPFEATSYNEPREIRYVHRAGILTSAYALKLASIENNKEVNYDASYMVFDASGKRVMGERKYLPAFEADDMPW